MRWLSDEQLDRWSSVVICWMVGFWSLPLTYSLPSHSFCDGWVFKALNDMWSDHSTVHACVEFSWCREHRGLFILLVLWQLPGDVVGFNILSLNFTSSYLVMGLIRVRLFWLLQAFEISSGFWIVSRDWRWGGCMLLWRKCRVWECVQRGISSVHKK